MKTLITGAEGFLGRRLMARFPEAIGLTRVFDLRDWDDVRDVFNHWQPEQVIHAAATVGGIGDNQRRPAEMFFDNLSMGTNIIEAARKWGVQKTVIIGSVCEYPKFCPTPFKESDVLNGEPEETNAAYGNAKRALLAMGQAYRKQYGLNVIHLLMANMYGPGESYDPVRSHVVGALVKKFVDARDSGAPSVTLWGTGKPTRELLYVEDAADAIVAALNLYDAPEPINIGTGWDIPIADLAGMIRTITRYAGEITWDSSRPDGQPKRLLDISKAKEILKWKARTELQDEGLPDTISDYEEYKRRQT